MSIEILMPKLGLTMTEGTLVQWNKQEGATVKAGETLFVLETEKLTYEVEASSEGVLDRILVQEGETVAVGTAVGILRKAGDFSETSATFSATEDSNVPASTNVAKGAKSGSMTNLNRTAASKERVRATPLAKKIARELSIDLAQLKGSGPRGRIEADDVRNAAVVTTSSNPLCAKVRSTNEDLASSAIDRSVASQKIVRDQAHAELHPLSRMRQIIAKNMMAAKLQTAQTYMSLNADASLLINCREVLIPYIEKRFGIRPTITDMIMKIAGTAILEHPVINTRWTEEGILFLQQVHMGMAMALAQGLIVPVIQDINHKGLERIAKERIELIKKGQKNKLVPDDLEGGTFTISALGMYGIESFTANINPGQSATLAVGAIIETPVVVEGAVVIRPMIKLNLTYDHRIIDGAEAAKFMLTLKKMFKEPIKMMA